MMKERCESGGFQTHTEAEAEFRKLVEREACRQGSSV